MRSPGIKTSTFRRARVAIAVLLLLFTGAVLWRSASLPDNSPLARMYRTEADLAALVNAVNTYAQIHDAFPPSGLEGLELAVAAASSEVDFFPHGPPRDGWGREFEYAVDPKPDTASFILLSLGADGVASHDDIVNDSTHRPWRVIYREYQEEYRIQPDQQ